MENEEEKRKWLITTLLSAIGHAIGSSERVSEVAGKFDIEGYGLDVGATIWLYPSSRASEITEVTGWTDEQPEAPSGPSRKPAEFELSDHDVGFLEDLKIDPGKKSDGK